MAWLPVADYIQTIPRATMYASLYFTNQAGHPLGLLSSVHTDTWQMAGGDCEFNDAAPFDTAVREAMEETGLVYAGPEHLLLTHYMPPSPSWPCPKVGFIYDGGVLSDDQLGGIKLDPTEHFEWQVHPLETWAQIMKPPTYRRLRAIVQAREAGGPAQLFNDTGH